MTLTMEISIHALREEGDRSVGHAQPHGAISIHALREEGDEVIVKGHAVEFQFLSTPSARRATPAGRGMRPPVRISIHALREEGDGSSSKGNGKGLGRIDGKWAAAARATARPANFYPRPPRGGRHGTAFILPTILRISIHALREEGDSSSRATAP